jgi:predicted benzoate:H+ symporter BenE
MRTRRYTAGIVLVIALIGVTALSEALERLMPVIPLVDMVQLVGVGVCFGIAISALYARLRSPHDHSGGEPEP